ncbi:hypothetical protein P280DRAFT_464668 [Massarina eburnea CBS 473.64]|uniref:F-box domain-containing protein n=1 Tax=Massarina eburnea CBS 473.64 TaxID=1395130 RepID=A0A6A6SJR8_9PLEO|nr:hypothetical protein P280DRAFT_464668 [Massarina eburnea CBS 473.64]
MASINNLPDELLHCIAKNSEGRFRNTDLANLSLVSRRLTAIAQEVLICDPRLQLGQIHNYLRTLSHHMSWAPKIQRLEIWSNLENRGQPELNALGRALVRRVPRVEAAQDFWLSNTEFFDWCLSTITQHASHSLYELEWGRALNSDMVPAFLGILFVSLPGLKELKISATWLMDFRIFSGLLVDTGRIMMPFNWDQVDFLASVLPLLQSRLETLEFPTNNRYLYSVPSSIEWFDFRTFTTLTHLSLPMFVLGSTPRALNGPVAILPPSLELLRITEGTKDAVPFVKSLCREINKGKFPSLKRVKIFFGTQKANINDARDLKLACGDVKLGLFMYFPGVDLTTEEAGRSLWSLKEERVLWEVEGMVHKRKMGVFGVPQHQRKIYEPVEYEWDVDGDIEML